MRNALPVLAGAACALIAACGGGDPAPAPEDTVRRAATAYVDTLRSGHWDEACDLMTRAARAAVAEGSGSCPRALRSGGALPRETLDTVARQLRGAEIRIAGTHARLGPVGDLPDPLRFERRAGRWLLAP
jgi:hypothetical protein